MIARLAGLALMALLVASPSRAATWTVDMGQSRIGFTAVQLRAPFEGRFRQFDAKIDFDPQNLAESRVEVEIAIESVDSQNQERDEYIVSHAWMAAKTYPTARFETTGFSHLGGERYEAKAKLTMRGISRDVVLPFTLKVADDAAAPGLLVARANGSLTVKRNDFGIGQGEFRAIDLIGGDVTIRVSIVANRPK